MSEGLPRLAGGRLASPVSPILTFPVYTPTAPPSVQGSASTHAPLACRRLPTPHTPAPRPPRPRLHATRGPVMSSAVALLSSSIAAGAAGTSTTVVQQQAPQPHQQQTQQQQHASTSTVAGVQHCCCSCRCSSAASSCAAAPPTPPVHSALALCTQHAEHLVLRLVPKKKKKGKGVRWAEDVVDNEFAGKKKSKSECRVPALLCRPCPTPHPCPAHHCRTASLPRPQNAASSTASDNLANGATAKTATPSATAQAANRSSRSRQHQSDAGIEGCSCRVASSQPRTVSSPICMVLLSCCPLPLLA